MSFRPRFRPGKGNQKHKHQCNNGKNTNFVKKQHCIIVKTIYQFFINLNELFVSDSIECAIFVCKIKNSVVDVGFQSFISSVRSFAKRI